MSLENGNDKVNSYMGSICSLFLFMLICLYGYQKMDVLVAKKDVDMLSATLDYFYEEDFVFHYQNGFNVALAFTAYDDETEVILDDTYGEIVFNVVTWGDKEDGEVFYKRERLDHHRCTPEELGTQKGNAKFLPMVDKNLPTLERYQKKFDCLDEKDLFVYGDFNSENAR